MSTPNHNDLTEAAVKEIDKALLEVDMLHAELVRMKLDHTAKGSEEESERFLHMTAMACAVAHGRADYISKLLLKAHRSTNAAAEAWRERG